MTFKPVDAAIVMVVGPCIDDTDFKSLEEAIAYNAAGMDVSLIVEKTDGTTTVTAITLTTGGTSDWTHKDGGYYEIEVTAAQNAEEGIAYLRGICTGVLPFESPRYNVVKANVYDSLVKGTDVLQTDVTQLAGVAQSLTDLKDFADNCFNTVSKKVNTNLQTILGDGTTASDLQDLVDIGYNPTTHKIQGVVLADTVTALTGHTAQTGDSFARLGAPDGASIAADLVVIDNFVDELETRLSAIRAGYLDNLSAGAVALASGVDLTKIHGVALTETIDGYLAAAFTKLFDVATPLLVASDVMRGTDLAALAATALTDAVWTNAKAAFLDAAISSRSIPNEYDIVIAALQTELDNPAQYMANVSALATAAALSTHDGKLDTVDGNVDDILLDTGTDGVVVASASKTGYALVSTGANLILKDSTFALAIADAIWDEILTGATHNIATSAGKRVREIGAYAIHSGTAQAGNSIHLTLAAAASANNGVYNRNLLVLTDGNGAQQTRTIIDYNGTTKIATIDREWRVTPDATTEYQIVADDTPLVVDQGIAQSGTSTTIKIREYASSIDSTYLCNIVIILAGTGRGQARLVSTYNGTTKVITICGDNWATIPDNTSVYALIPYGASCVGCITDAALGQINGECDTALADYDGPTRTEATSDKDEIIVEVDANETKIDALNDITVADIIAGISDGTNDLQEMQRIMFAAIVGKSSGGGTVTLKFRNSGDTKDRITATVDAKGNRTAVTLDGS